MLYTYTNTKSDVSRSNKFRSKIIKLATDTYTAAKQEIKYFIPFLVLS